MRICEREGCSQSLEGKKPGARFCSPRCRSLHWQTVKGVKVGYVRVRPARKRYPRIDWKGAYEDACDAIQILLERLADAGGDFTDQEDQQHDQDEKHDGAFDRHVGSDTR